MRLDMFVWDENIGAEISSSPWVQLDTVADATGWIDDEHDEAGTTEFVEDGKLSNLVLPRIFEISRCLFSLIEL
jgi:hypothetical protein